MGVRWKEEEDRVPCDRKRCPGARVADAPGAELRPVAEYGRVGGVEVLGETVETRGSHEVVLASVVDC